MRVCKRFDAATTEGVTKKAGTTSCPRARSLSHTNVTSRTGCRGCRRRTACPQAAWPLERKVSAAALRATPPSGRYARHLQHQRLERAKSIPRRVRANHTFFYERTHRVAVESVEVRSFGSPVQRTPGWPRASRAAAACPC